MSFFKLAAIAVLVAAVTAAAGIHFRSVPGDQGPPARCSVVDADRSVATAGGVASLFVVDAVFRLDPACAFDLTTEELRQGLSRDAWASGNIPVQPVLFSSIAVNEPVEVTVLDAAGAPCDSCADPTSIEAVLHLAGVLKGGERFDGLFDIRLVYRDGWRVDYWGPQYTAAMLPRPTEQVP